MAEEQKSDLYPVEVEIQRELAYRKKVPSSSNAKILNRSPGLADWAHTSPAQDSGPKDYLALPHFPSLPKIASPTRPQNDQLGQSYKKNEPWPNSSESKTSAYDDWIGPNKLSDQKSQIHRSSHEATPPVVPCPNQRRMLLPGPRIPTKMRSVPKRKSMDLREFPPRPNPASKKSTTENLVCELCQVSCSSGLVMKQHLNGRRHKAKLNFMKLERSCHAGGEKKQGQQPKCDTCQIWCSDWYNLEMHLKGQKHRSKMQELEGGKCRGSIVAKKPILCELCAVHCMNEDLYKMHLRGRQHATREELKRRGML